MNNNIIKNKIYIYGDGKDVTDLKKFIRSDNSLVDFNEIEPMTSDSNDFILDDFMNFCLNVYIKKSFGYATTIDSYNRICRKNTKKSIQI